MGSQRFSASQQYFNKMDKISADRYVSSVLGRRNQIDYL